MIYNAYNSKDILGKSREIFDLFTVFKNFYKNAKSGDYEELGEKVFETQVWKTYLKQKYASKWQEHL